MAKPGGFVPFVRSLADASEGLSRLARSRLPAGAFFPAMAMISRELQSRICGAAALRKPRGSPFAAQKYPSNLHLRQPPAGAGELGGKPEPQSTRSLRSNCEPGRFCLLGFVARAAARFPERLIGEIKF